MNHVKCRAATDFFNSLLAHLTGIPYEFLRSVVSRPNEEPYRITRIRKRQLPGEPLRYRIIAIPDQKLMATQRWINANILVHRRPHDSSMAFYPGDSIRNSAALHCGCRWLIKLDLKNFFETINERRIYKVFRNFGYLPLVAFELARLCTRRGLRATRHYRSSWQTDSYRWTAIYAYRSGKLGHLPQGAPTSPRLANLAVYDLDKALSNIADRSCLVYTRYADDLVFSTPSNAFSRAEACQVISKVYKEIANFGLSPNVAKTQIASPGSRKIVLGLLVDRDTPRLTREFKRRLRQHLYYLNNPRFGPAQHAAATGGGSIYALRRHIDGLIAYAKQIEPEYGLARLDEFRAIEWP